MPRHPHPRKGEALAYLDEHPHDHQGAAALIGVTERTIRGWLPGERGRGERGADRKPRPSSRAALIAELLLSEPEASTEAIGAALGVTGQRVRQVRAAYLTDEEHRIDAGCPKA